MHLVNSLLFLTAVQALSLEPRGVSQSKQPTERTQPLAVVPPRQPVPARAPAQSSQKTNSLPVIKAAMTPEERRLLDKKAILKLKEEQMKRRKEMIQARLKLKGKRVSKRPLLSTIQEGPNEGKE